MKSLKIVFASLLIGLVCSFTVEARNNGNEPAFNDGNFGLSELGAHRASTQTRRMSVTDTGQNLVAFGVTHTSWTNAVTVGSTISVNWVDTSTNSRNINCIAVASSSQPVLVTLPRWGQLSAERIRIYDSRGTTTTATTVFDKIITSTDSSSNAQQFQHWCSSGVTVVKGGTGDIIWTFMLTDPDLQK